MDNYHFDGEGYLTEPTDSERTTTMIKEYNDKKPFTAIVLISIALVGITIFVGVIYALTTFFVNLFDLLIK